MKIEYVEELKVLFSYNNLWHFFEVKPCLSIILPKDNNLDLVENNETTSRYQLLKTKIKEQGLSDPIDVTSINGNFIPSEDNKLIIIDGMTRLNILGELVAEGHLDPDKAIIKVNVWSGFNNIEEVASWLWEQNQATRGFITNRKLGSIYIGLAYNNSKNPHGTNQHSRSYQNDKSSAQLKLIAEQYNIGTATVSRYAKLATALHKLAQRFNKEFNFYYPLYINHNITIDRLVKLSECYEDRLIDYFEKYSDDFEELYSKVCLYITQKEKDEAAQRKVKEAEIKRQAALQVRFEDYPELIELGTKKPELTMADLHSIRKVINEYPELAGAVPSISKANLAKFLQEPERLKRERQTVKSNPHRTLRKTTNQEYQNKDINNSASRNSTPRGAEHDVLRSIDLDLDRQFSEGEEEYLEQEQRSALSSDYHTGLAIKQLIDELDSKLQSSIYSDLLEPLNNLHDRYLRIFDDIESAYLEDK